MNLVGGTIKRVNHHDFLFLSLMDLLLGVVKTLQGY